MIAYAYDGALYCDGCAQDIVRKLTEETQALDPSTWPLADGGGEADSPQHCDRCGLFLENPLTDAGRAYVRRTLKSRSGVASVLDAWREFYELERVA